MALLLAVAGPASARDPQIDYMLECQGCHLADGAGAPGAVPDLRGSVGRFLLVPRGRAYLVRVPGAATSRLSDAELAAVLNWMVRRFGPARVTADFAPFTADEVARERSRPLLEVQALREELLRALEASPSAPGAAGGSADLY